MTYLENSKQYTGSDLENIFFRPMLTGESAQDLGVRVLYNMPQPTHVQRPVRSGAMSRSCILQHERSVFLLRSLFRYKPH